MVFEAERPFDEQLATYLAQTFSFESATRLQ